MNAKIEIEKTKKLKRNEQEFFMQKKKKNCEKKNKKIETDFRTTKKRHA